MVLLIYTLPNKLFFGLNSDQTQFFRHFYAHALLLAIHVRQSVHCGPLTTHHQTFSYTYVLQIIHHAPFSLPKKNTYREEIKIS